MFSVDVYFTDLAILLILYNQGGPGGIGHIMGTVLWYNDMCIDVQIYSYLFILYIFFYYFIFIYPILIYKNG